MSIIINYSFKSFHLRHKCGNLKTTNNRMHGLISNFYIYTSRDQKEQGILPFFLCQVKNVQSYSYNEIKKAH